MSALCDTMRKLILEIFEKDECGRKHQKENCNFEVVVDSEEYKSNKYVEPREKKKNKLNELITASSLKISMLLFI